MTRQLLFSLLSVLSVFSFVSVFLLLLVICYLSARACCGLAAGVGG